MRDSSRVVHIVAPGLGAREKLVVAEMPLGLPNSDHDDPDDHGHDDDGNHSISRWARDTADLLMREVVWSDGSDDLGVESDSSSDGGRRARGTSSRGTIGRDQWETVIDELMDHGGGISGGRHSPTISSVSTGPSEGEQAEQEAAEQAHAAAKAARVTQQQRRRRRPRRAAAAPPSPRSVSSSWRDGRAGLAARMSVHGADRGVAAELAQRPPSRWPERPQHASVVRPEREAGTSPRGRESDAYVQMPRVVGREDGDPAQCVSRGAEEAYQLRGQASLGHYSASTEVDQPADRGDSGVVSGTGRGEMWAAIDSGVDVAMEGAAARAGGELLYRSAHDQVAGAAARAAGLLDHAELSAESIVRNALREADEAAQRQADEIVEAAKHQADEIVATAVDSVAEMAARSIASEKLTTELQAQRDAADARASALLAQLTGAEAEAQARADRRVAGLQEMMDAAVMEVRHDVEQKMAERERTISLLRASAATERKQHTEGTEMALEELAQAKIAAEWSAAEAAAVRVELHQAEATVASQQQALESSVKRADSTRGELHDQRHTHDDLVRRAESLQQAGHEQLQVCEGRMAALQQELEDSQRALDAAAQANASELSSVGNRVAAIQREADARVAHAQAAHSDVERELRFELSRQVSEAESRADARVAAAETAARAAEAAREQEGAQCEERMAELSAEMQSAVGAANAARALAEASLQDGVTARCRAWTQKLHGVLVRAAERRMRSQRLRGAFAALDAHRRRRVARRAVVWQATQRRGRLLLASSWRRWERAWMELRQRLVAVQHSEALQLRETELHVARHEALAQQQQAQSEHVATLDRSLQQQRHAFDAELEEARAKRADAEHMRDEVERAARADVETARAEAAEQLAEMASQCSARVTETQRQAEELLKSSVRTAREQEIAQAEDHREQLQLEARRAADVLREAGRRHEAALQEALREARTQAETEASRRVREAQEVSEQQAVAALRDAVGKHNEWKQLVQGSAGDRAVSWTRRTTLWSVYVGWVRHARSATQERLQTLQREELLQLQQQHESEALRKEEEHTAMLITAARKLEEQVAQQQQQLARAELRVSEEIAAHSSSAEQRLAQVRAKLEGELSKYQALLKQRMAEQTAAERTHIERSLTLESELESERRARAEQAAIVQALEGQVERLQVAEELHVAAEEAVAREGLLQQHPPPLLPDHRQHYQPANTGTVAGSASLCHPSANDAADPSASIVARTPLPSSSAAGTGTVPPEPTTLTPSTVASTERRSRVARARAPRLEDGNGGSQAAGVGLGLGAALREYPASGDGLSSGARDLGATTRMDAAATGLSPDIATGQAAAPGSGGAAVVSSGLGPPLAAVGLAEIPEPPRDEKLEQIVRDHEAMRAALAQELDNMAATWIQRLARGFLIRHRIRCSALPR